MFTLLLQDDDTQIFSQSLLVNNFPLDQSISIDHEETVDLFVQDEPAEGLATGSGQQAVTYSDFNSSATSHSSSSHVKPSRKRKSTNNDIVPLFEKADVILNTVQSRLGNKSNVESIAQACGRYLTAQLEKIQDEEIMLLTQQQLQTVVMDARLRDLRKRQQRGSE